MEVIKETLKIEIRIFSIKEFIEELQRIFFKRIVILFSINSLRSEGSLHFNLILMNIINNGRGRCLLRDT